MAKISKHGGGGPEIGQRLLKVRVKSLKKRTLASRRWLERQLNDPYVAAAQREGWRSRAAYKLLELDDKLKFLKPGQRVVDLGAAPGGWSQLAADRVRSIEVHSGMGQVIAIDISPMEAIPGVQILHLDFMLDEAPALLVSMLRGGRADVVLTDMAAPASGHTRTDHIRIMGLAEAASAFAVEVLAPGGVFVAKVLQGGTERELLNQLKANFSHVRHIKPPASRADSAELYVVATGFRGIAPVP
jgi:23S rRNA (uridine2552-2'-O)-methyltransferase